MIAWLALLVGAALAMWVGTPLLWLYLGSQIEAATGSLGLAMLVMLAGSVLTIAGMFFLLGAITGRYQGARTRRGHEDTGGFPLEVTLVCTAFTAGTAFAIWFFGFAGAQPFPFFGG
jgi:hypothetical protein